MVVHPVSLVFERAHGTDVAEVRIGHVQPSVREDYG